jgi:hypothetical protein
MTGSDGRQEKLQQLIRDASEQPGIRELMAVYEKWRALDSVAQTYRHVLGAQRVVVLSSSSTPALAGQK